MSSFSRDARIYGETLIPAALLARELIDPMKCIKDLESDLAFSVEQNTTTNLAAVMTSQETVQAILAQLAERDREIERLRAELLMEKTLRENKPSALLP